MPGASGTLPNRRSPAPACGSKTPPSCSRKLTGPTTTPDDSRPTRCHDSSSPRPTGPTQMPLGKPLIERRRKQKPRRAVKLPEIAHQDHRAGESIAPWYPVHHMIRQVRQAARASSGVIESSNPICHRLGESIEAVVGVVAGDRVTAEGVGSARSD
jgi:hypothetical protein